MFALSLLTENPGTLWRSLTTLGTPGGWAALGGLAYIVLFATVAGSGIWTTLMGRNPASVVAPFSLLVPVVGMSLAFLLLGERPTWLEALAGSVVIGGVLLGSVRKTSPSRTADVPTGIADTRAQIADTGARTADTGARTADTGV
jgi:O-acetylserine/cysteine efflux transporter